LVIGECEPSGRFLPLKVLLRWKQWEQRLLLEQHLYCSRLLEIHTHTLLYILKNGWGVRKRIVSSPKEKKPRSTHQILLKWHWIREKGRRLSKSQKVYFSINVWSRQVATRVLNVNKILMFLSFNCSLCWPGKWF